MPSDWWLKHVHADVNAPRWWLCNYCGRPVDPTWYSSEADYEIYEAMSYGEREAILPRRPPVHECLPMLVHRVLASGSV